ncbi:MAG: hypothetical protein FWD49_04915 [Firmicutes bacterium]|nr:hypothetical protein [Bacillota bacterium]
MRLHEQIRQIDVLSENAGVNLSIGLQSAYLTKINNFGFVAEYAQKTADFTSQLIVDFIGTKRVF